MKFNPDIHHRHSIKIKQYDYSKEGLYFITICTQNREKILSNIINNNIILSEYGKIVENEIVRTQQIRKNIIINDYVIMPNHIHIVIEIQNVGVAWYATQKYDRFGVIERSKMVIPKIIQQLKTVTIKKSRLLKNVELACYSSGLHTMQPLQWQRNYYEHIIRNEKEYLQIQQYIQDNPLNWENDQFNY